MELDSDDDNQEKTIEMNLMFYTNTDSSSDSEYDEQIQLTSFKNNKQVIIVEIESTNKSEENNVSN